MAPCLLTLGASATTYRQKFKGPPRAYTEAGEFIVGKDTHRVAISNHRLLAVSDTEVGFRWKDSAHGSRQRITTLSPEEFLRRFMQHVLPKGFPRIRYFGWMAIRKIHGTESASEAVTLGSLCLPVIRVRTTQASDYMALLAEVTA